MEFLTQFMRIMRLTIVIITMALMQVSAAGWAQKVSLNLKNVPLEQVLIAVQKQTAYNFVYTEDVIGKAKPVNINVNNADLKDVLEMCFKNQPLNFSIEQKTIVIKEKEKGFFEELVARFQTIDVRGRVVDEKGQPLVGASVSVKGGRGTTTDRDGNFQLTKVNEKAVLVVSFIGYFTKELIANSDLLEIKLEINDSKLDEVQVIAYGTTSQRYSTSNIVVIKADAIAKQPISNPLLALQGRVPGLFVQQTSGLTSGAVNVTIQGRNSLQRGSSPFYVIDGIPFSPQLTESSLLGLAIPGGIGSAFNFINSADIESISILKDADATAIYGSRAANGAILITTKKGKAGKTKVDFNLQSGWGKISNQLQLLNTSEYLQMRKEAYVNAGVSVPSSATNPATSNFDLTVWDQNRYTDWQKELVGGTASFTDIQGTVSGGSVKNQFLVGYGYNRQTSVYPNSLADLKGNIHLNLNNSSDDSKFKYSLSASYLQDKNKMNGQDLMSLAMTLAPNAPALYNVDGTLNWEPYPNNPNRYSFMNPLRYQEQRYQGTTENLMANNSISYQLLAGLDVKMTMGYNKLSANETNYTPITYYKPDNVNASRTAAYLTKSLTSWIIEPQINYKKDTKFGSFDILMGSSFQETKTDVLGQSGSGYSNDVQLENILSASSVNVDLVTKSLYRYNAIFARLNYRFKEKYIINLSSRRDGTSRFGNENKLHTFYGVGGAWLFGEENIVKKNLPWLSSGKIRINYGTTGNDQISDYTHLSLLDNFPVTLPYQNGVALYPTQLNNPYLQWEETRKLNIGMNLGFLNNRMDLDVNYFLNRSSNQLLDYLLPSTTGFNGITENFPATVQNKGLEVMMNFSIIKHKNFSWNSSVNYTSPRNTLLKFQDIENSTYANLYIVGLPINVGKAYKFAGVNPQTGIYEVYNSKGERTSAPDPLLDATVIIDPNPKWYGGITNSFQYKSFQLDFLVQAVQQHSLNYQFGNLPGAGVSNQPSSILDRWRSPGDVSKIQKASSSITQIYDPAGIAGSSDAAYSGSSYVRLKNASISYTFPDRWVKFAYLSSLRLYAQGQNLITITNFVGTDPEINSLRSLPPLRMITLGVQIGL